MKFFRTRRGELVFVMIVACLGVVELGTRWLFHDEHFYQTQRWPISLGFLLAAGVVRACLKPGSKPTAAREPDSYISSSLGNEPQASGESVLVLVRIFRTEDSFLLIPVRFWPWILFVHAVTFYFFPISDI
ncbi:MAG: hypothetical protein WCE75_03440 [Terracidiphilus sp.]